MKQGKFIVFDGMDGCGKDTQMDLLKQALAHLPIRYTREPGSLHLDITQELQAMIYNKEAPLASATRDFILFWADRIAHMEQVVLPTLQRGIHVFGNRGDSSSMAFQVYGEENFGLAAFFIMLRERILGEHVPDAYVIFDLPAEVAYERSMSDGARDRTKFDEKSIEYHRRVRDGFLKFVKIAGVGRVHLIDADRSVEEVHEDLVHIIGTVLTS